MKITEEEVLAMHRREFVRYRVRRRWFWFEICNVETGNAGGSYLLRSEAQAICNLCNILLGLGYSWGIEDMYEKMNEL